MDLCSWKLFPEKSLDWAVKKWIASGEMEEMITSQREKLFQIFWNVVDIINSLDISGMYINYEGHLYDG